MAEFGNQYSVSSRQYPVYSRKKGGVKLGKMGVLGNLELRIKKLEFFYHKDTKTQRKS